jgi:general secretion pathway protein I
LQATREIPQRFSTDTEAGFTLIEIVVALAILSLSLGVLFSVISDGIRRTDQAGKMARASSLAQSLLAQVGAELPVRRGETTGEAADGFRWRLRMEPYGNGEDRRQWPVGAYTVSVDVSWGATADDHAVTLSTLRLGAKEAER